MANDSGDRILNYVVRAGLSEKAAFEKDLTFTRE